MTISPNRRSTKRGRPLVTDGAVPLQPMSTNGQPAQSVLARRTTVLQLLLRSDAHSRCLPRSAATTAFSPAWPSTQIRQPICLSCAGIPGDFTCRGCGTEGDFYRRGTCARCALRQDLTALMIDGAQRPGSHGPDRRGVVPGRPARQHPDLETLAPSPRTADRAGQRGDPVDPCRASTKPVPTKRSTICAACSNTPVCWLPVMNRWPGSSDGSR